MDTSVFNLHGAKDYDFSFLKQPELTTLNRTDNFFLKYQFIRKLFIPVYTYSPYFFNRFVTESLFNNNLITNDYTSFCVHKQTMSVWKQHFFITKPVTHTYNNLNNTLVGNFSNTTSATRNFIGSTTIAQNQIDALTTLFDILSKKDFFIKSLDLGILENSSVNLFKNNQPSLKNPLVITLRAALLTNELLLKQTVSNNPVRNNLTFFFKNYSDLTTPKIFDKVELRSQYQPLRKGIVNMIRIQADRAIAMPTDTRLQILAVSKDIIHS